jgi:hypothetical protein
MGSLAGTGGGRNEVGSLPALNSAVPSPERRPSMPNEGPSSISPPDLCRRRARSWTVRNFSRSSFQRMMPSSRPFSLFGRSKLGPLGVVTLLWVKCVSSPCYLSLAGKEMRTKKKETRSGINRFFDSATKPCQEVRDTRVGHIRSWRDMEIADRAHAVEAILKCCKGR